MAYIFNICCLVAAFICGRTGVHFWKNYQRTKIWQFKNFSLGFWFISLAYLFLSFPKIILFNSIWIQIDFILADISFLVANLFLIPAAFSFLEKFAPLQKRISQFFLSAIIIYIFLNIFFFAEAIPLKVNGVLYYWKNGIFWLHSILWIPLTSGAAILGGWFLSSLKKVEEKRLFWKSLFSGMTGILIFIAGILFWYFKFFNPFPEILNISGLIGVLGFLFGVIGVTISRLPYETWVKKIT